MIHAISSSTRHIAHSCTYTLSEFSLGMKKVLPIALSVVAAGFACNAVKELISAKFSSLEKQENSNAEKTSKPRYQWSIQYVTYRKSDHVVTSKNGEKMIISVRRPEAPRHLSTLYSEHIALAAATLATISYLCFNTLENVFSYVSGKLDISLLNTPKASPSSSWNFFNLGGLGRG